MANISLKDIQKIYPGGVTAVRDFNLEINDKEFMVFVGPSGCGKSTTLRMIAGLEEITQGDLYIGERRVNNVSPKDRDIAMVFQNYALYPHMSVFANMAFSLKLRKMPKREISQRVHEAAGILDIEDLLNRKPKALSGGQRQRVALGRAMVRNPAAFLLDEPLSNLDAKLRAGMRTELIKLHKRIGATFVYVTHDQIEAMTMGDRIVVMKDGLIQQVDSPQNLYDSPCNIFVASFIGSPQMNFLEGTLEKNDAGYFVFIHGSAFYMDDKKVCGAMGKYIGKPVKIGIRPENIHADKPFLEQNGKSIITPVVEILERMGNEAYLHLNYQGTRLIARVASDVSAEAGCVIQVGFHLSKLHLFDPETEVAIAVE